MMDKGLSHLSFVLNKVNKKLSMSDLGITAVKDFVLSLIGDEKQLDYNATLNNNWNKY